MDENSVSAEQSAVLRELNALGIRIHDVHINVLACRQKLDYMLDNYEPEEDLDPEEDDEG